MIRITLILIQFLFVCLCEGKDPIAVYLTWHNDPTSSMTIQWISDGSSTDNLLYWHNDTDDKWQKANGKSKLLPTLPYRLHRIELTKLEPNTIYSFQTSDRSKTWKFRTMPKTLDGPLRFVVGGDVYHDTINLVEVMNRVAAKFNPHFALVGGDISYAGSRFSVFNDEWQTWVNKTASYIGAGSNTNERWVEWLSLWTKTMVTPEGLLIPMLPALGNHDVNGRFNQTPADATMYYALFPKKGYGVTDFSDYMTILHLDTQHTHPIAGKQTTWLQNTLEKRKQVPHKFAFYHVPAYPSSRSPGNEYSTLVRTHWVPLFETGGIHVAFEHHDHLYKRTLPLKNNRKDKDGVVYMGDGAWGVKSPRKASSKWYLAHTDSSQHVITVTVTPQKRIFRAINSEGKILDHYEQTLAESL